jgi:hypothetical protein
LHARCEQAERPGQLIKDAAWQIRRIVAFEDALTVASADKDKIDKIMWAGRDNFVEIAGRRRRGIRPRPRTGQQIGPEFVVVVRVPVVPQKLGKTLIGRRTT